VVDLVGGADLSEPAGVQDREPVRQRHRHALVVGGRQQGDAVALLDVDQVAQQRLAAGGVDARQRFVQQQHRPPSDQRPGERHVVALPGGQGPWPAVEQALQGEHACLGGDALGDLVAVDPVDLEREPDVRGDVEVGLQARLLRDHGDVPGAGGQRRDVPAVEPDPTGGGFLQAGDHPQQRGLAGTGGTEEDDALPGVDPQVDVVEQPLPTTGQGHPVEFDAGHPPECGPRGGPCHPRARPVGGVGRGAVGWCASRHPTRLPC
jgi:hypothetical protein